MAVPNNYIDKIKKDGDSRMISPAADMVRVDNDNFEGTDLDEVLDEVAQAIGEAGEGGYAPPAGGIPKTDLAPAVQASLAKADSALQPSDLQGYATTDDVDDAVAALVSSAPQTLDTLKELADALGDDPNFATTMATQLGNKVDKETGKGLSTNDYTTAEKTKLAGIAAGAEVNVQPNWTQTNTSADDYIKNKPDLSTYATKTEVNAKQDVISDLSAIRSGAALGATALQSHQPLNTINGQSLVGNGNITVVGEKGDKGDTGSVTVTDGVAQITIVNDLTTGGTGDALSAEMGKVLKTAITTLIDSMGEYCFPLGRPALSFEGPKCDVTQNLTDVTSDFNALRIDEGGSLEIKLTPSDNLHVFLTGDVTVEMPLGNDITSTAWNESTGKVTIADVDDDVVITAKSSTYVDVDGTNNKLAFMLDCKNGLTLDGNGVPTKWTDIIGGKEFTLTSVTIGDNGALVFSGSPSKGVAIGGLNVKWETATVEAVVTMETNTVGQRFLSNSLGGCVTFSTGIASNEKLAMFASNDTDVSTPKNIALPLDALNIAISATRAKGILNGSTDINYNSATRDYISGLSSSLAVGYRINPSNNQEKFLNGTISIIRVYQEILSDADRKKNYEVDKKRFNLQ